MGLTTITGGRAVHATADDVLAVLSGVPLGIGPLGLEVVRRARGEVSELGAQDAPVGQRLAAAGLSLSALQRLVDSLVGEGRVLEVRGRDLWDRGLATAGTKAMGRYYLAPDAIAVDGAAPGKP